MKQIGDGIQKTDGLFTTNRPSILNYMSYLIRTNERSRNPDGEAGPDSWGTYGMIP